MNTISMPRTEAILNSFLKRGLFDSFDKVEGGFDFIKNSNKVSVRLTEDGKALIYNSTKKGLTEVVSARLDEVLHRFILQEFMPVQKSAIGDKTIYSFFVPKEKDGKVFFYNSRNEAFRLANVSKEDALAIYKECIKNNADDVLLMSNNFVPSSVSISDEVLPAEFIMNNLNLDQFAVSPSPAFVNDAGKTIVGEFATSAVDKDKLVRFEKRLAGEEVGLMSSKKETKSPAELFSGLVNKADYVLFELKNSKQLDATIQKDAVFSAKFELLPNVEVIKNALHRNGVPFSDIEGGLAVFVGKDADILNSIVNSCSFVKAYEDEPEKDYNKVSHLVGSAVTKELKAFGLEDNVGVFTDLLCVDIV